MAGSQPLNIMRGIIRSRAGDLHSRTKPRSAARLRIIRIMSWAPAFGTSVHSCAQLTGVRSAVGSGERPLPRRSPHPCGSRRRSAARSSCESPLRSVVMQKQPPLRPRRHRAPFRRQRALSRPRPQNPRQPCKQVAWLSRVAGKQRFIQSLMPAGDAAGMM